MDDPIPIPVFIRNLQGQYLSGDGVDWSFTDDPESAHVFDYHADQVAVQLADAHRNLGLAWVAWPVDPLDKEDAYKTKCYNITLRLPAAVPDSGRTVRWHQSHAMFFDI